MPVYRLHDTTGDDLGLFQHPAPNVAPGDVVVIDDGRKALVMARVETDPGRLAALLEVAIAPRPFRELATRGETRPERPTQETSAA